MNENELPVFQTLLTLLNAFVKRFVDLKVNNKTGQNFRLRLNWKGKFCDFIATVLFMKILRLQKKLNKGQRAF